MDYQQQGYFVWARQWLKRLPRQILKLPRTYPKTTTLALAALAAAVLFFTPYPASSPSLTETKTNTETIEAPFVVPLSSRVQAYLESKGSPLAPETEYLMEQEHWRLLIAISAIESQFCKRKIAYNCWGIGGDSAYRKYSSYREAIKDANDLIERWQNRGRWLTVEDMNCHYVVPCSENWVRVTNKTLGEIPE